MRPLAVESVVPKTYSAFRKNGPTGLTSIVAGVIGKKKFIYDMWGDTVNVASRMAADARAGAIQVDLTTYRRLHTRFTFDAPHEVEIKGKGRMQVHHLLSRN